MNKVLIVELDQGRSTALRQMLERNGFVVESADSVRRAVASVQADSIPLCIVHYDLGKHDATDLLQSFKKSGLEVPCIILADSDSTKKAIRCIKLGAKDFEFYDSTQTYKDTYINTVRLHDSLQTIYLVLLEHYPTGEVNSRALFYDNQKKVFADNMFDFNLWVLYDYENGKLTSTKLKTDFEISTPEIEVVDFNKDGINDFKFVKLWHNGTFNAIHTTILTVSNNEIDTLHFDEEPIGNEELRKE